MSAYAVSARGLASRRVPQGVLTPMNTLLFGSGEQGAWYDPADLSTLFQDTAGTTPVTAVEQFVALMLDKSGNGNHATQATSPKRFRYSRRVNLLPQSHNIGGGLWLMGLGNLSSSVGTGSLPVVYANSGSVDGELANRIVLNLNGGTTAGDRSGTFLLTTAIGPFSICVKSLDLTPSATLAEKLSFNTTGQKILTPLADGSVLVTGTISTGNQIRVQLRGDSGLDSADFLIGKASITLAIDAHLPYQWVNTATDYDADPNKFPAYLACDGVDDAMVTGNIDFTGTDKMTVWAGVTKLSDAAAGIVCELSPNLSSNTGVFSLLAPVAGSTYGFYSKGASLAGAVSGLGRIAPHSSVITGIGDISGDRATLRELSVQTVQTTTDQGSGNYGNHPLYIGGRGGILSHFNGRLYGLIVRGAQSSLSQIEAAELYTRRRMMLP